MAELFENFGISTLSASAPIGSTTLNVQTGHGTKYPSPSGSDFFRILLFNKSTAEYEIVTATDVSGDVITCSATTIEFNAGDACENRVTKEFLNSLNVTDITVQSGEFSYGGVDTGAADAYEFALTPALLSYKEGMSVTVIPGTNNTGAAATLDLQGLGVKSIKLMDNTTPSQDMIVAGRPATFIYSSNTFWLVNFPIFTLPNIWTKTQSYQANISDENGVVAWDLKEKPNRRVRLTGDITLSAPTNPVDGASYRMILKQDDVGGHAVTFNSVFKFPMGVIPVLDSEIDAISVFNFIYDSEDGVYLSSLSPPYS